MVRLPRMPRAVRWLAIAAAILLLLAIVVPFLITPWLGGRVHAFARARGLEASWNRLAFQWPATVVLRGISLRHASDGVVVFSADRAEASLAPRSGSFKPRVTKLVLGGARIVLPAQSEPASDMNATDARTGPAAPKVRATAGQVVDAMLLPARQLPELQFSDIDIVRGDSLFARLAALSLEQ